MGERKGKKPEIEMQQICIEGLDVTVYFSEPLSDTNKVEFEKLITSWYEVGVFAGFGGHLHNLLALWTEEREAGFTCDMGSAEQSSLDTLIRILEDYSSICAPIDKIVIGTVSP